jgi:hypothetical protein
MKSWTTPAQGYLIEEKMGLPIKVIKPIMKDLEKLMKKHDAYVSKKTNSFITISSPKPFAAGFNKDLNALMKAKGIKM